MDGTEWHNVGSYRFGWDVRPDSCRFIVLRRPGFWHRFLHGARADVVATGFVEYWIVGDMELHARARGALEIEGVRAADMRCVRFVTDDGSVLDEKLRTCMAGRWHEMQTRLRYGYGTSRK